MLIKGYQFDSSSSLHVLPVPLLLNCLPVWVTSDLSRGVFLPGDCWAWGTLHTSLMWTWISLFRFLFSFLTPSFTSRASAPDVIQQKMLSGILHHTTCSQRGTTKSHSRDGENWLSCSIRPDSRSSSSSTNLNQHISKIGADIKMMRWHFQTALLHCLNHNNQLFNQRICWMTKTENETIYYERFRIFFPHSF